MNEGDKKWIWEPLCVFSVSLRLIPTIKVLSNRVSSNFESMGKGEYLQHMFEE